MLIHWTRKNGPRIFALMALPLALAQGACGAAAGSNSPDASEEDAGDGDAPPANSSIEFSPSDTLTLGPGETAQLSVIVEPARRQSVSFEILGEFSGASEGGSARFDGFLLQGVARVGSDGRATTELKAPSQPATFVVRASLSDGTEARRAVSVSSQGYGSLRVVPVYAGSRKIDKWIASARAGVTCEQLEGFFTDGPLSAQGAKDATVEDVPSGPPIAVTLRGDELVSGCTTYTNLGPDQEAEVKVTVTDRPLNISEGTLELSLSVESTTDEFALHLEQAIEVGVTSLLGAGGDDAEALLLWMAETVDASEKSDFQEAVAEFALREVVAQSWKGKQPLSDTLRSVLSTAANTIPGEDTFLGELELSAGSATFYLSSAAGIPTALSGFFGGAVWKVSAESLDEVVMSGSLTYEPLRWLFAIANVQKDIADMHSTDVHSDRPGTKLKEAARCADLASAIVAAVDGATHSDCAEACLVAVCEGAVLGAWDRVNGAGNDLLTSLMIGVSGNALVSGKARIQSLDGSWVGRLGGSGSSIKGPMSAQALEIP